MGSEQRPVEVVLHGPAAEHGGDGGHLAVVGVLPAGGRLPGGLAGVHLQAGELRRVIQEPAAFRDDTVRSRQGVQGGRDERLAVPAERARSGRGAARAVAAAAGHRQLARRLGPAAHRLEVGAQLLAQGADAGRAVLPQVRQHHLLVPRRIQERLEAGQRRCERQQRLDEPLHAEAGVGALVRRVDAHVRAGVVRLSAGLEQGQGIAAHEAAEAHSPNHERGGGAPAGLAHALDQHAGVSLYLVRSLVEPHEDHVVARLEQAVERARRIQHLVEVVAWAPTREPLDEDHGVLDLAAARSAVDVRAPRVAAHAAIGRRGQRPDLGGCGRRGPVAQRHREPRRAIRIAVTAANGRRRGVALRVLGLEGRAERGRPEAASVARVQLDLIGKRRARVRQVERGVQHELDTAAAVHRRGRAPLLVQQAARDERVALLDRRGEVRGRVR